MPSSVGPWIFMPTGVLIPVSSMSSRFWTGMVQVLESPGNWSLLVHLLNQLFVGHSRPPLLARLEHDRRVVHVERRIVRRAVRAPDRTEDAFHFRERCG